MSDAIKRAEEFLNRQRAFRLGELLTESSHPKTKTLSQTAEDDLPAAIRLLQSVDDDIPPAMEKVFGQESYRQLLESLGARVTSAVSSQTGASSSTVETYWHVEELPAVSVTSRTTKRS